MSILEQFYILFASNAKDVKRDMVDADKATNDFEKSLKSADETSAKLGLSFEKLALSGIAALEGFASLNKLKDAIVQAVDYNAEIEKTSRLTGVNARELSLWNGVVARAGGDPGGREYLGFLKSLNERYASLGVNDRIKRVNEDLLKYSSQFYALEQKSPGSSQALAARLGIGPDLWLALKDGPAIFQANIDKQKELNNTTAETAKASFELKQQWADTTTEFTSAFTSLIPFAKLFLDLLEAIATTVRVVADLFTVQGWKDLSKTGTFRAVTDLFTINGWKDLYNQATGGGAATSTPPTNPTTPPANAPRGIRNNNPGNLRSWGGAQTVGGFAQFSTLGEGLHAEDRQLQLYGQRGIDTLAKIVSTWAPGRDGNNVPAYIAALQKSTGFDPNAPLNLNDPAVRAKIAAGINAHENGAAYGDIANQQIAPIAAAAQSGIAGADSAPLNGVQNGGSKTIQIGSITIQTQATDADGISKDLNGALEKHFNNTIGAYDDGVAY